MSEAGSQPAARPDDSQGGATHAGEAADAGTADATDQAGAEPLPLPPVAPRIAQGRDYERCLDMLPADPSGALTFAEAWEATGGGDGAQHCEALARIDLGDPAQGAALLDRIGQSSNAPALARAAIFGQADQAWLMAGDAAHAFASATLALTLSPDDPELLIDRSTAAATLERFADAITDLDRALAIDPRRADALVLRAAAERQLGRLDRAAEDVEQAIALDPDDPDALLERGIIRERNGDRVGAREDWERATSLAPDSPTGDLAQQNLALLEAGPAR